MRWNRPSGRPIFSWKDLDEGPEQTKGETDHQKQGSISVDIGMCNYRIQVFDGTRLQQGLDSHLPERSPHPRDDTITLLRGMPEAQHPRPDRECRPHTMLVPCSGTTKNSSSPLHMARTHLLLYGKNCRQVGQGLVFPDSQRTRSCP
jgi:hypothetical protein